MGTPPLTRRTFLGGAVTLACLPPTLSCGPGAPAQPQILDGWGVPWGTKLTAPRYAALAAATDAMIPGSAGSPGATEAHAAWYLDQLLSAFDVSPPRIFAGGPYSGRHGGTDGFAHFLELTRVEELTWRTFIEGSKGLPEREWAGPVKGLIAEYEEGLDALDALAAPKAERFAQLNRTDRRSALLKADGDFVQRMYVHAVEGTYGDPVYGGNFELKGWAAIGYEGDRHPLGYTPRQMLHPEELP